MTCEGGENVRILLCRFRRQSDERVGLQKAHHPPDKGIVAGVCRSGPGLFNLPKKPMLDQFGRAQDPGFENRVSSVESGKTGPARTRPSDGLRISRSSPSRRVPHRETATDPRLSPPYESARCSKTKVSTRLLKSLATIPGYRMSSFSISWKSASSLVTSILPRPTRSATSLRSFS